LNREETIVSHSSQSQVLIVGAVPTGLMLAIELTLLSLSVRIIDRASQSRACAIWSRAQEALAELGVLDKFREFAYQIHNVDLYVKSKQLGSCDFGRVKTDYPCPLAIEQHDTERFLAESLSNLGVEVEWETAAAQWQLPFLCVY
jgi:2-polyprenyl-6-methoxyphenol hydroxylase-like FAD-dependent oxidoreductase